MIVNACWSKSPSIIEFGFRERADLVTVVNAIRGCRFLSSGNITEARAKFLTEDFKNPGTYL